MKQQHAWISAAFIGLLLSGLAIAVPGNGNGFGQANAESKGTDDEDYRVSVIQNTGVAANPTIKVEIEDGVAEVKVKAPNQELRFELTTTVESEIVSQIASKTGLTESQVRERMRIEPEDDDREKPEKKRAALEVNINGKERKLRGFVVDAAKNRFRFEEDTNWGGVIDQNADLNAFRKGIVVKVSDGNKLVEITIKKKNGQTLTLDQNQISALANGSIEFDGNALYIAKFNRGKHAFKVLPEQASDIAKRHANFFAVKLLKLDVNNSGEAVYIATGLHVGKFFGIIPVQFESETEISAKTGVVVRTKKPWWALLVTTS